MEDLISILSNLLIDQEVYFIPPYRVITDSGFRYHRVIYDTDFSDSNQLSNISSYISDNLYNNTYLKGYIKELYSNFSKNLCDISVKILDNRKENNTEFEVIFTKIPIDILISKAKYKETTGGI